MAFCVNPLHCGVEWYLSAESSTRGSYLVYDPCDWKLSWGQLVKSKPMCAVYGEWWGDGVDLIRGPRGYDIHWLGRGGPIHTAAKERYWAKYIELCETACRAVRNVTPGMARLPGYDDRVGAAAMHSLHAHASARVQVLWIAQVMLMEWRWYHPDALWPWQPPPPINLIAEGRLLPLCTAIQLEARYKPKECALPEYNQQCRRWGDALNVIFRDCRINSSGLFGRLPHACLHQILTQCSWGAWGGRPYVRVTADIRWMSVEQRSPHLWPPYSSGRQCPQVRWIKLLCFLLTGNV